MKEEITSVHDTIGRLEFLTFQVAGYSPVDDRPVAKTIYFSRQVNGYDFIVSILYNNQASYDEILRRFQKQ